MPNETLFSAWIATLDTNTVVLFVAFVVAVGSFFLFGGRGQRNAVETGVSYSANNNEADGNMRITQNENHHNQ